MSFFLNIFRKKKINEEKLKVPVHIAIIPDGNRRWAKKRSLPTKAGHKEGAETFRRVVEAAAEMGIKYVTFYAFSTENWNRSKEEVDTLMEMLLSFLKNAEKELGGNNVKIKVIGRRTELSEELKREILRVEKITLKNNNIIVNIAINYGGRDEILTGVRNIAEKVRRGEISPQSITEDDISASLYTKDIPEPDLLIRTSGESRISNFLLWQLAYTELYFADVLWPDFSKEHLKAAVQEYGKRNRRFGGA